MCYTFHLWCVTCWAFGGQHGSWAVSSTYLRTNIGEAWVQDQVCCCLTACVKTDALLLYIYLQPQWVAHHCFQFPVQSYPESVIFSFISDAICERELSVSTDSLVKSFKFKVCSHLTFAFAFASTSPFNISSMEMQTHMHRMGLNPFLTFYIDTVLNFDGDVDANANANVKCEHTIKCLYFCTNYIACHFEIPKGNLLLSESKSMMIKYERNIS